MDQNSQAALRRGISSAKGNRPGDREAVLWGKGEAEAIKHLEWDKARHDLIPAMAVLNCGDSEKYFIKEESPNIWTESLRAFATLQVKGWLEIGAEKGKKKGEKDVVYHLLFKDETLVFDSEKRSGAEEAKKEEEGEQEPFELPRGTGSPGASTATTTRWSGWTRRKTATCRGGCACSRTGFRSRRSRESRGDREGERNKCS
jgi:hypothetical protein